MQIGVNISRLGSSLDSLSMALGLYLSVYSLEYLSLIDFIFIVLLSFFSISSSFIHTLESYEHKHSRHSQHINNTSNKIFIHTFLVLQEFKSLLIIVRTGNDFQALSPNPP